MTAAAGGVPRGNRVLDALPPAELRALSTDLVEVELRPFRVLAESGLPPRAVYFPVEGVISMVVPFSDGSAVEVATIGSEGIAGVPAALSGVGARTRLMVQVEGRALSLPAQAFAERVLDRSAVLRPLVLRYNAALFSHIALVAGCNRLHGNESRMARWLLMTGDRMSADEFAITQEFLAQMLGVRRETVTVCARILQAAGMIRYQRGRVRIVDRGLLTSSACECYRAMAAETDSVFRLPGR